MITKEKAQLKIDTKEAGARLANLDGYRNKVRRFGQALAGELKPETTVDGFVWAVERVLMNQENDFDGHDRFQIRNELPGIIGNICFASEFRMALLEELADIKKGTLNLG